MQSLQKLDIQTFFFLSEKFGLYHVDFTDPKRKRTPKASAKAYAHITHTYTIDWNHFPTPDVWIGAPGDLKINAYQSSAAQHSLIFSSTLAFIIIIPLVLQQI